MPFLLHKWWEPPDYTTDCITLYENCTNLCSLAQDTFSVENIYFSPIWEFWYISVNFKHCNHLIAFDHRDRLEFFYIPFAALGLRSIGSITDKLILRQCVKCKLFTKLMVKRKYWTELIEQNWNELCKICKAPSTRNYTSCFTPSPFLRSYSIHFT